MLIIHFKKKESVKKISLETCLSLKNSCILFIPKVVILIGGSLGSLRMFLERLSNKSCYEFNSYFTQTLREIHCASGEWIIHTRVLMCSWMRLPLLVSLCWVKLLQQTDCQYSECSNATFRSWWQRHEAERLLLKENGKREGKTETLPRRLHSGVITSDSHWLFRSLQLDRTFPTHDVFHLQEQSLKVLKLIHKLLAILMVDLYFHQNQTLLLNQKSNSTQ